MTDTRNYDDRDLRNIYEAHLPPQRHLPTWPELLTARPGVSHFADACIENGRGVYHEVERRHTTEELMHG